MKQSKCFYTPREREKYSAEVLGKWNFAKKNDFPRLRMNEKQEKTALRQVPKTRKSKKQSFGTHRRSENRKNSSSAGAENEKIQKTELRHLPTE
ncbi:hypothetical protein AS203_02790 [Hoylesella enoeca]|uniref:Uncharacterized protein n=1 Tax=Hoylesella enoeca TaxID=76123 RepID=A0A0S2KJK5_9BACT|nr:hypothetical protein AS203_02790 [Hoylesella enoeca]